MSWNNLNNSYIYTIGLTIPTNVGMLSIAECTGFSFLVDIGANFKFMSSKFGKINKWGGRLEKISTIYNMGDD